MRIQLVSAVIVLLTFSIGNVSGKTLIVGPHGFYSTITSAVNASSDNDTVFLQNGVYRETISTSKNISFLGESETGVIWTTYAPATGNPQWLKTDSYDHVFQCGLYDAVTTELTGIIDEDRRGTYKRVNSISEVDQTPGTYYASGGTLFVRSPDNGSPAGHGLMFSEVAPYTNTLYFNGSSPGSISNITFVGSSQYAIHIKNAAEDLGNIDISNITVICSPTGAIRIEASDSAVGGTISIGSSTFQYNISPVYDTDYPVHTDEDGNNHPYSGSHLSFDHLNSITISDSVMAYTRNGISVSYSNELLWTGVCWLKHQCIPLSLTTRMDQAPFTHFRIQFSQSTEAPYTSPVNVLQASQMTAIDLTSLTIPSMEDSRQKDFLIRQKQSTVMLPTWMTCIFIVITISL